MRSCLPWPRLCSEPSSEANRSTPSASGGLEGAPRAEETLVGVYDGEVGEAVPLYSGETGPVAAPSHDSDDPEPDPPPWPSSSDDKPSM